MRIGILGGTFDPPHNGHILIANSIKKHLDLDEIWLMPGYIHPFGKKTSSQEDRLSMVKYLANSFIKVSDFEIKKKGTSFTIDTLSELSKMYPENTFYWIIGSDQLASFKKWKDWRKLIVSYNFIIFPRPGTEKNLSRFVKESLDIDHIPENIIIVNEKEDLSSISSTEIRKKIELEESVKSLVPEKVEEYIIKHKLYK